MWHENMTTVQCGSPHRRRPSPEATTSAGEQTTWVFLYLTVLDPNRSRLVHSGPIGGRYSTVAELRAHQLGLASLSDGAPHARCISISMTCLGLFGRYFPESRYAAVYNIAHPFCCVRCSSQDWTSGTFLGANSPLFSRAHQVACRKIVWSSAHFFPCTSD